MCSFLYTALFSLCHFATCKMIMYVYIDVFIRSHELKARDRHFGGFHVFGGSVCCHFDNLRCSRGRGVVDVDGPLFFTDCHIIFNQLIFYQGPRDSGSTSMRGPDNPLNHVEYFLYYILYPFLSNKDLFCSVPFSISQLQVSNDKWMTLGI